MIDVSLAFSITALLFAVVALTIGCIGLSVIVGLKNSTHKIQVYDPATNKVANLGEDFNDEEPEAEMVNPNKRKVVQQDFVPFSNPEVKEEEPFIDLDDPNTIAHDWRN